LAMTQTETLTDRIDSLAAKDWKLLFDLLPQIKSAKKFGKLVGSRRTPEGTISMPFWLEDELVSKFFNTAYFLGIIVVFDWATWTEGIDVLNNPNADFNQYELSDLCKLLTIIVRADKFCEGYLINAFETGTVTKIVEAMQAKLYRR
jgi:uncharacterized protein DUF6508